MRQCSPYGNYRTRKFTDIFTDYNTFKTAFTATSLGSNILTDSSLNKLYYLLYAKYGNSHIAMSDETQWKYRLYSIIFMYGPSWEKELDVQTTLRGLSETDLRTGTQQVSDHAFNPSTTIEDGPNNPTGEILTTNEQQKNKWQKSKLDAYANLLILLKKDVTNEFLNKFNSLFIKIVEPQLPLWYESEE